MFAQPKETGQIDFGKKKLNLDNNNYNLVLNESYISMRIGEKELTTKQIPDVWQDVFDLVLDLNNDFNMYYNDNGVYYYMIDSLGARVTDENVCEYYDISQEQLDEILDLWQENNSNDREYVVSRIKEIIGYNDSAKKEITDEPKIPVIWQKVIDSVLNIDNKFDLRYSNMCIYGHMKMVSGIDSYDKVSEYYGISESLLNEIYEICDLTDRYNDRENAIKRLKGIIGL